MIIGLLGDTHGRVEAMAAAIEILTAAGARFFIHTGDVGGEAILDYLAGLPCAFVFGNNDWDRTALSRYAQALQVPCHGNCADLRLDGKCIAVIHGDDARLKQRLLADQQHDYLIQGHTHVRADERIGRTRIINPGALHRAAQKSVATLDTDSDTLRFLLLSSAGR